MGGPTNTTGFKAISAGSDHSLALRQDGTVVAWGFNYSGQTEVPSGLSEVIGIAAGGVHNLALKQDGTVVAWGRGLNVTNSSVDPVKVPAGLGGVIGVAAGYNHSLALKQDGTVVAWGANPYGESTVPPGLRGVVAVAAGWGHSLALKQDGTVVAWGSNLYGQTRVPSGLSGVIAIATRNNHSLALRQDGTVVAWGFNDFGETEIPSDLSGVIGIATGGDHSLALKRDGTVVAWGGNSYGESTVPPGLNGVVAIAAGGSHSLALVNLSSFAPVIKRHPQTQTAEAGSTIKLHVVADGALPLTYQWHFGSIDLTNVLRGRTNSFLDLSDIQPLQAGNYTVLVTNLFGAVTSGPAMLSVIPPVPRRSVPAINLTNKVGSILKLFYANTLGPAADWQLLDAVAVTNTPQLYLDLSEPLPPTRFYRSWQTNVPSQPPVLEMRLATEITLAGSIGSKVQIDYIQQFGPTDAWVTLDTVTFTNTTQPFFDIGTFRWPARLYRLTPMP